MQPYTRIRIPFMSKQLNIPEADVERLLVSLILDKRIEGHIDQVRPCWTLEHCTLHASWNGPSPAAALLADFEVDPEQQSLHWA